MVKEAERLGRIVDDLLNLSLIETQESPLRDPMPLACCSRSGRPRAAGGEVAGIALDLDDAARTRCSRATGARS